jgi:predicted RNA binding protein YcfA (HicA-like mRNA interferase family)
MSGKLSRVSAADVIKAQERVGFPFPRQNGSDKIYKNKEGRRVTAPYHS